MFTGSVIHLPGWLSSIFATITNFFANITGGQIGSLVVVGLCIGLGVSVGKKVLSVVLTIVSLVATLYFIDPGLFDQIIGFITGLAGNYVH